jgi:hypothetical protein
MTDLLLQELSDLTREKLGQILSDEKKRMFADQKPKAKKAKGQTLKLISRIFERREKCLNLKS